MSTDPARERTAEQPDDDRLDQAQPAADERTPEEIAADLAEENRRAEALRAGLADYVLEDEDLAVLEAGEADALGDVAVERGGLAEVGEESLADWKAVVDLGDFVSVTGRVISSRRGELSVLAQEWTPAAKALLENTDLPAAAIVKKSLEIAGDLCIYTNMHHTIETL